MDSISLTLGDFSTPWKLEELVAFAIRVQYGPDYTDNDRYHANVVSTRILNKLLSLLEPGLSFDEPAYPHVYIVSLLVSDSTLLNCGLQASAPLKKFAVCWRASSFCDAISRGDATCLAASLDISSAESVRQTFPGGSRQFTASSDQQAQFEARQAIVRKKVVLDMHYKEYLRRHNAAKLHESAPTGMSLFVFSFL